MYPADFSHASEDCPYRPSPLTGFTPPGHTPTALHRHFSHGQTNGRGHLTALLRTFLIAGSLFIASPALADEEELAPGYSACLEKAVSTMDMQQCTSDAYAYWDRILNENYAKSLQQCAQTDNATACRDKLRKAQRLWVQYKEAMTDAIIELEGGGSLSRLLASDFAAIETKKQARLLAPDDSY